MPSVTELSGVELAAAIRRREVSSREVVATHIERLRRFAPRINAIVADRYEAALADAEAADALIAASDVDDRGGAIDIPPLLGVPFTVKESIALEGMPNAAGVIARRAHRAERSARAVQRLIDAGAIPLGVTNTSELTLWIESDNRLYGRTSNPYDPTRTAGGSSGGEGAAVGCGGAPFGIASDIAGSIRVPALFCGVFGHKPSPGRVPNSDLWPPSTGNAGRMLSTGLLARRADDLMPILALMSGPDGADHLAGTAPPLGDPRTVDLSTLTVTLLEDTARRPLQRDMRDARERAAGALQARGARLRRVPLRDWRRALVPFLAALGEAAAGPDARSTTQLLEESGEPPPGWLELVHGAGKRHTPVTRAMLAVERLAGRKGSLGPARRSSAGPTLAGELLEAIGDGVVLHPAHPRAAPRHGTTVGRPWLLTPAAMFNLAGVPVTEVPLGLNAAGLPLGVQVAGPVGADHVTIAVALELERIFGGWVSPPSP